MGTTLTKEVKDLYNENYKTLLKEIEIDINEWEDILCLWNGRPNIVNMQILSKVTCGFNAMPIKYQWHFFCRDKKITHPKIHMES